MKVCCESTFLRYTANTKVLEEILAFPFAQCCTRNKAISPEAITGQARHRLTACLSIGAKS